MSELRELDQEVALVVMSQTPCDAWKRHNFGSAGGPVWIKGWNADENCSHEDGKCYPAQEMGSINGPIGGCPRYSSRIACAFQVEDRIAELGLQREYVDALMVIIYAGEIPDWDLIHASPEQRCRAALEAVREKAKAAGV